MRNPLGRGFSTAPKASNVVEKIGGWKEVPNSCPEDNVPDLPVLPSTSTILPYADGRIIRVELPLPPSINALYRSRAIPTMKLDKHGKPIYICTVYMSNEGKAWLKEACLKLLSAGVRFPEVSKVVCEVKAFWPDARDRDMNNLSKITCDALQHSGMVANDKRVLWREMDYHIDRERPRMELAIYEFKSLDGTGAKNEQQR